MTVTATSERISTREAIDIRVYDASQFDLLGTILTSLRAQVAGHISLHAPGAQVTARTAYITYEELLAGQVPDVPDPADDDLPYYGGVG